MSVALVRLRMRLANSGANRNVHLPAKEWKPLTGKQSAHTCIFVLSAICITVGVIAVLRAWFG